MTDQTAIETTIRAYAAAWAARDREAWLRTFAADATQEDPVGDRVRRGHDETGELWDREMARYKSIEIIPRDVIVIGREAVMVWTINGATPEGAAASPRKDHPRMNGSALTRPPNNTFGPDRWLTFARRGRAT